MVVVVVMVMVVVCAPERWSRISENMIGPIGFNQTHLCMTNNQYLANDVHTSSFPEENRGCSKSKSCSAFRRLSPPGNDPLPGGGNYDCFPENAGRPPVVSLQNPLVTTFCYCAVVRKSTTKQRSLFP